VRKLLSTFSAVAILAILPLAAGCGADDLSPEAVADAAEATQQEGSAKVDMTVSVSGFGLPVPLSIEGKGTSALDAPRLDVTFDLGPILGLAGQSGDGATRVVALGKDVYVRPPAVEGLDLPSGARWVGLDLAETVRALGVDPEGIGALFNADPAAQLDAVTSAKGVEKVGEETIDGVETTHFRGEVRLKDLVAALPPERRAKAQQAIDQLLAGVPGGDAPQPIEIWIDDENRIRRMKQQAKVPAQQGLPEGRADVIVDYSDFGVPLDVQAPPDDETFDATKSLTRILRAQAGAVTQ
jgi:hypothetical protein